MKEVVITRAGGPEVLRLQERPTPTPAQGQVRITVKAAGINFADILARKGLYPDSPPLPCVVGYEVAGVIDATGEGVAPALRGKEVIALTRFKGYADTVIISADQIVPKPDRLSFEEAAAIPVTYVTAWQLLVVMGGLKKGERVLIHNAGGGVGLAALDIALHCGAETIGTASGWKHPELKKRGYHELIDYRTGDWTAGVMSLTGNRGVELVIDPLGGAHWKKSYRVLRPTGRLGMFGVSTVLDTGFGGKLRFLKMAAQMPWFNPISLMNANRSVFGVNVGHLWKEGEKVRAWLEEIMRGANDGWVRPVVARTFPLAEAAQAHEFIENRQNIGKVILIP